MKTVLVIAVHPDDETLGCGGTLLKHRHQGDQIHWGILTSMSEASGYSKQAVAKRKKEIDTVGGHYGFQSVTELGLPPAGLDDLAMKEIIGPLSSMISTLKPEIVYLPCRFDVHSDHRVAFNAAWSCLKPFRAEFVKKIYMMETLSETEMAAPVGSQWFVPNSFVDITAFLDKKLEIMNCYESEIKAVPFPRSEGNIRALAQYRGASSGCEFAEAFMLLKERW